jgi:GxxExxY protein
VDIFALCDTVRQTGYEIHRFHRNGHLEKVYENALAHRLRKAGFAVSQQHPVPVFDEDGAPLGNYYADLLVADKLIVEVKAVSHILDEHTAQILGYLRSSKMEHGLLINFGAPKFAVRKFVLTGIDEDNSQAIL